MAWVDLMEGDCLDCMREIENGSVDLTVTSPPYDNMRTYNSSLDDWTETKWQSVLTELYRVTKNGGAVVWNVNDATIDGSETGTSFKQVLFAMSLGFKLADTMIWEKTGSGALGSQRVYAQNFEYMFVLSKGKHTTFNPIKDRENVVKSGSVVVNGGLVEGKGTNRVVERKPFGKRNNIWRIPPQQRSDHPAAFPVTFAEDHIKSWSNEGDTVLDPFLGSGTTGVACQNTNRNFIGIERDPGYFTIACERMGIAP